MKTSSGIQTFNMDYLVKHQSLIDEVLVKCPKRIFFDNYHMFRLFEYLKCYNEICARFDFEDEFTYLDIGSCRSYLPFFVADTFPNATVIMSDREEIDSYFIYGKPTYPQNLVCKIANCQTLSADISPESIDVISCISVIEHVDDEGLAYSEMLKCLKPNGVLCMTTDIDFRDPQDFHPRRFNLDMFIARNNICSKLPKTMDITNAKEQQYQWEANKKTYNTSHPKS